MYWLLCYRLLLSITMITSFELVQLVSYHYLIIGGFILLKIIFCVCLIYRYFSRKKITGNFHCLQFIKMRCMITYFPQTFSAIFLINFSFFHCWSTVNMFPFSLDENPHCGLRHNLSRDMNSDAL